MKQMIVVAVSEYDAYLKFREKGFKPYAVRLMFGNYYRGYTFEQCLNENIMLSF